MKKPDSDILLTNGITYLSVLAQIPIAIVFSFAMILPVDIPAFSWETSRVLFAPWLAMFSICFPYLMVVNVINIELDRRFKWERSLIKRAGMQTLYGWILPVVGFYLFALKYLGWIDMDVRRFDAPHVYYAIVFIPLIVNMGYLLYYKYKLAIEAESSDVAIMIEKEQSQPDEVTFQQGRSQINVNAKDIAYVESKGNDSNIKLHEGQNVSLKKTPLKLIEDKLSPNSFCRVNRSTIISRDAYVKHQRNSRRLLIFLRPETGVPVLVARNKVSTVLDFLKKRHSEDT